MLKMTSLRNHSEYTFYHSANVAILSVALASTITRDARFLSSLGAGALLHDIGKIAVGLEIIEKPGKLEPEEWDRMRQHPVLGAQMASQMVGIDSSILVPILEHHMAWDGSGYPSRMPRRKQHIMSRIVAVADSFDAMTSKRSYSGARGQDQAMKLIVESAGTSLDPALVKVFVRMMGVYPPRSVVLLSDNRVGIVIAPSEVDAFRPIVRVLTNNTGAFVTPEDVALIEFPKLEVAGLIEPRSLNIDIDDYL
jgi:putative nucleotidyltransferase with HDIG domain